MKGNYSKQTQIYRKTTHKQDKITNLRILLFKYTWHGKNILLLLLLFQQQRNPFQKRERKLQQTDQNEQKRQFINKTKLPASDICCLGAPRLKKYILLLLLQLQQYLDKSISKKLNKLLHIDQNQQKRQFINKTKLPIYGICYSGVTRIKRTCCCCCSSKKQIHFNFFFKLRQSINKTK